MSTTVTKARRGMVVHQQHSTRHRHPNTLVAGLLTLVFLVIAFIFKIHVVDLPSIESSHRLHNRPMAKRPPLIKATHPGGDGKGRVDSNGATQQKLDSDRQQIFNILEQAGFDVVNDERFDQEMLDSLPKWSEVMDLYGEPNVIGLETCQAYRESVKEEHRTLAVAGNFNSGTNFLYELIRKNCMGQPLWQVPWGKHIPAVFRETSTVQGIRVKDYNMVLPVVTVRDPYTWMQSQCRQPYNARFDHNKSFCPNIIPYPFDRMDHPRYAKKKYVPIHVTYSKEPHLKYKHQSLAHFWNNWNNEYMHNRTSSFPRLVVRLEDLVFHGEKVIPQICECAGYGTKGKFHHKRTVANWNRGIDKNITNGAGLLQSLIRYGNPKTRRTGYSPCQLWAAKDILDARLMKGFGYHYEEKFGPDPSEWRDCFGYLEDEEE